MNYFEQRARELLADALRRRNEHRLAGMAEIPQGLDQIATSIAVDAIQAALSQSYAALRPMVGPALEVRECALRLLAAHYDHAGKIRDGRDIRANDLDTEEGLAVAAIVEALTPPDGYVLVPMSATERMRLEGWKVVDNKGDRAHQVWEAMLAARPEVPHG